MRRRTGSAAVQVALGMTTLLGVAAVVIDLSAGRLYKQQFKNASEAAAHAGAAQLDGTAEGMVAARDMAVAVAAENLARGTPVVLDRNDTNLPGGDIVLGYWEDGAFVPSTSPPDVTAMQVVARRAEMDTILSWATFDEDTVAVGDYSVALGGGPSGADCPFPLALPDCELVALASGACGEELSLSSARLDNGAWSRVGGLQANAAYIQDSLDPNVCAATSDMNDLVQLNNGQVQSAFKELADAVNMYGIPWDTAMYGTQPAQSTGSAVSPYGNVLIGQVVVFDDPDNCVDTSFTGTHEILGYATILIYDVVNSGSNKTIKARTLCEVGTGAGGGGYFGTIVKPNFVH